MGRTIQQILDHADELADRFEAFDPSEANEIPVAEYLLHRAVRSSPTDQAHLIEAVTAAREAGTCWIRIGEILGVSGRDAQQWYNNPAKPLEKSGPSLA